MEFSQKVKNIDCWAPVTALNVHKDYLFAGSGNKLEVWSLKEWPDNRKPILVKWLNCSSSIHGIKTSSTDDGLIVTVNGNRFLSVFNLTNSHTPNCLKLDLIQEAIYFKDWIMTVRLKHDKVFAILSSNSITIFDLRSKQITRKVSSSVQCILYSALIISIDSTENALIASGTVFKQTLIWCLIGESTKLIDTLEGHDGAIFALEYDYNSKKLFTASDDRSIHIWQHNCALLDSSDSWSSGQFTLCHRLFSHTARIWSLITLSGYLFSCGENDEICLWSSDSGKLLFKSNREDASLWCLAASQERQVIYIGSSDSSIRVVSLKDKLTKPNRYLFKFNSTYPKSINYIKSDSSQISLVCVSNDGFCSKLIHIDNQITQGSKVYLGKDFESYCITSIDDGNFIYCASKTGHVKVLEGSSMQEQYSFQAHNGKIFTCLIVDENMLLTSGPKGEIKLWINDQLIDCYQIPPSRHRWISCALYVDNCLIAGDANGHLSVFNGEKTEARQCLANVHSSNGVNDIKFRPSSDLLYSCGREGKVYEYLWNGSSLTKLRLFPLRTDFDWIERILFDNYGNLFLIGFSSTNLIVWQQSDQSILCTIDCGGGHRLWNFNKIDNRFNFCFTKQSELHFVSHSVSAYQTCGPFIKQEFHSNRINCCCLIDYVEPVGLIVTGGEDNNILISEFNTITGTLQVKDCCKGHISAVRAVSSIQNKDGSLLIVSGGGQSQLIVWLLRKRLDRLIISQVANNFLDPNGNTGKRKSWKDLEITNDPKSRYLSINIDKWKANEDIYMITVACSDSNLKLFSLAANEINFIGEVAVSNYCPLVVNRINETFITGSTDGYLHLWNINNQLMIQDSSLESQMKGLNISPNPTFIKIYEQLAHQSGINCISSRQIHDNVWLILSTGDDTILTATLIKLDGNLVNLITQKKLNYIHSSQISVVSIINDVSLITCSIDQRLKLWNYSIDADCKDITINPVSSHLISVADISSAAILTFKSNHFVIITGEGIQILKISE
ncbi:WD repeat-containing protein 6 [Tetranychus urticae]|uniref:tRNA (34-2'-O)-methyltransferase regulator WDR6 n=1 Tax=Tetranychus urticae TaxID=32264 RepID=T1JQQ0_TETUR|nr:WD repeat-containing protein 6 [Tetranychus urticae]